MKCDFKEMENEMDSLAANMSSISNFSEQISSTLHVSYYTKNNFTVDRASTFLYKFPGHTTEVDAAVVGAFNTKKTSIPLPTASHFEEEPGGRQLR
jgi:hypothetical protein